MYKKILLTGVNGQVGHALNHALTQSPLFVNVVGLDRAQLDLTDADAIRRAVDTFKPDLIINPAAYTAVDKAESESELAYAINAEAPKVLAEEAARIGAHLIHFSTDYVYSGSKVTPYVESDETGPLSVYGKSKLMGEEAIRAVGLPHLIFRTSWVYGAYGNNFLKTVIRLARERDALRIVADQTGAPTSSRSIADALVNVLAKTNADADDEIYGTYHLVNAGKTTWHGFATAIVEEYLQMQQRKGWPVLKVTPAAIQAITTQEYPTPAVRPANSSLDCDKLARDFSVRLPEWRDALTTEMKELQV